MAEADELPRTIVRRVVKGKLAELIKDMADKKEISVHKEAVIAFSESAKIFIHYLSATANDICRESKRQTITAEDVLKAIEEIEFPEFLDPLKIALEEFRRDNAIKRSEAKEKGQGKKRKSDGDVEGGQENGEVGNAVVSVVVPEVNLSPEGDEDGNRDADDMQES